MATFVEAHDGSTSVLAQSYRVPKQMHDLARGVVSTIGRRVQKSYRAARHPGAVVKHGNGFDPSMVTHGDDVMILCRSHTQKKEVEEAMIAARKPYRNEGGRPGLYDSIWADALRAYRRLADGKDISQAQMETLQKVGSRNTIEAVNRRDFRAVVSVSEERAINVPFSLVDFFRDADLGQDPTIRVSTIHASKGREARHVVLHTGITARTEAGIESNPDAEARVWYVGITRAKERLDVVAGHDRSYNI